ncbi:hypothetical protein J6590_076101 [Homalodisca vitripennis]|nr:hypothetical protein J6590_076101 [Homalodisca vitripennis]
MPFLDDLLADKRPQVSNLGYADDNETDAGVNDAEKTTEHLFHDSQTEPSTPPHPPPKRHAASSRVVQKKGQEPTDSSQVAEYEMIHLIGVHTESIPWSTGPRSTSSSSTNPSPMLLPQSGEQHTSGEFQHYQSRASPDQTCRAMVPFNLLVQCIITR